VTITWGLRKISSSTFAIRWIFLDTSKSIKLYGNELFASYPNEKNWNSVLKFFSNLVYKFETDFNLYMITYSNRILKTRNTYMTSVWEQKHANRSVDTATQSATWQLHNFANYLFPLLLSTGVLQPESLASHFCLFNWRCLIKVFVESVFVTCPSKITKWFTC
jgi:hypothetical protein